jgi:aldose 1-epimerase
MKVTTKNWGKLPDGREVKLFRFECHNRMTVSITNYGANITSILLPDRNGNVEEITAGFDNLQSYVEGHPYFGIIAGRVANRIKKGQFEIDGTSYHLATNNGPNHLHGGPGGFHTKLWDYKLKEEQGSASLVLSYLSPDMEEGYPGNLAATVTYTISDNNTIHIRFEATTDKATHVNLTNHTYFNLGAFHQRVFDHDIMIDSQFFIEVDETQIPTGTFFSCAGTPYDLSKSTNVGKAIETYGGIDHCFVLNPDRDPSNAAAILTHPASGRSLRVFTTQPGIQLYTGNNLDSSNQGHNGVVYEKQSALCLETQHFPDSPNHPEFPSTLLKPGEKYDFQATFVFNG